MVKLKSILLNIALAIFSTIMSLCIVELLLIFFFPQISEHDNMFRYNDKLGWEFIPNNNGAIVYPGEASHFIKINDNGFREQSNLLDDQSKKIMVIGDSFVSNVSVAQNDLFTTLLEKKTSNTNVLNFGVNGYGTVQEYLLLKNWINKVRPDLIILVIYIRNDFFDNVGMGANWLYPRPIASLEKKTGLLTIVPPKPFQKEPQKTNTFKEIYERRHFYQFVRSRFQNIKVNNNLFSDLKDASAIPPEFVLCRKNTTTEGELIHDVMEKVLQEISKEVTIANIPWVIAVAPSIIQVEDDLWNDFQQAYSSDKIDFVRTLPNDMLRDMSIENNWMMVDLFPKLNAETRKGRKMYNAYEQHWNSEGNEVVAEVLLDFLKKKLLLNSTD